MNKGLREKAFFFGYKIMNSYLKFLKQKSRFTALLTVLFVLLITIPALLTSDYKVTAKIVGVFVVIILSASLWIWRMQTIRKISRNARIPLNLNDRYWLNEHISFYNTLSKADKKIFEDRIGLFLAEIRITEIGKESPDKATCLYVACSAVISFWGLPYWNYGELSEVLVYPNDFSEENSIDEKGNIQGKIHHGGLMDSTMILSLPSLVYGFSINDGRNVGIHEFSHLLDKEDDSIDGLPFMFSSEDRLIWSRVVERELRKKQHESKINGYAYTDKTEFFAVLMEVYHENPNRIKKRFPELYDILASNLAE